jgi:hypothetical protein
LPGALPASGGKAFTGSPAIQAQTASAASLFHQPHFTPVIYIFSTLNWMFFRAGRNPQLRPLNLRTNPPTDPQPTAEPPRHSLLAEPMRFQVM